MSDLEKHDYIDILGYNFKYQLSHLGGVYLLSNKLYWDRGVCKVGVAKHFGKRLEHYRSCFGFLTPLYLFGLIIIAGDAKDRKKVEKKILDKFENLRLPYPDTDNNTEWIRHDPLQIKTVFSEFRNQLNEFNIVKIITNFESFSKVHQLDLEFAVVNKSARFSSIQYLDGMTARIPTRLLNLLLLNGKPETVHDVDSDSETSEKNSNKIKCPHCEIRLWKKSLKRHLTRKHSNPLPS
jgi:hypothetical protein